MGNITFTKKILVYMAKEYNKEKSVIAKKF